MKHPIIVKVNIQILFSLRYPNLILPLTAGFDSRLLFLCSLDINCE